MRKKSASDVFKDIENWKSRVIDINDPEVKALIERTRKSQDESLRLKFIDDATLRLIITI